MRDFKSYLKTVRRARPASVNLALAAVDHFYRFLGTGRPDVRREELVQAAPRALSPEELRRFLRAVERCESPRDRAIALLLVNTGLRIGECAALDVDDMAVSARKGRVVVREGKGDAYREVPLNAEARDALDAWTGVRRRQLEGSEERALFVSRKGARFDSRSQQDVSAKIDWMPDKARYVNRRGRRSRPQPSTAHDALRTPPVMTTP